MLKQSKTQLDNIYYISLPPSKETKIGDFQIDTSKKLPVETDDINNWNTEELTWEMIISAMLKIMAYEPNHEDIEYYRDFVFSVRPNIISELSDSGIVKSKNRDFDLASEIFLAIEGLSPGNDRNALNIVLLQEEKFNLMEVNDPNYSEQQNLVEKLYLNLLNRDAILSDTYFNAAYFFIKTRDFDRADNCLESFISSSDNDEKVEQAKKLQKEYKGLIENGDIFNNAYVDIINENEHSAIKTLESLLDDKKDIWNGWFLLGWAYRRVSNFTEAKLALFKAMELNPTNTEIFNELAICHMESGEYNESKAYLEKAFSINPDDLKIISNMGVLELKLGNIEQAKKFFETVIALDPEDIIAKSYLEQF